MLPAGESEFVGQLWQTVSPNTALYDPSAHNVHVAPSGPENPAGHCTEHSIANVLPGLEVVPSGHKEQVTSLSALNVPDSHVAQEPSAGPLCDQAAAHRRVGICWAALAVGIPTTSLVRALDALGTHFSVWA